MSHDPQPSTLFTHIDVTAQPGSQSKRSDDVTNGDIACLLQHLIAGQERQNELLEELVQQTSAAQRQRANELGQWKEANPYLARRCRNAAEALSSVQTEFLQNLTDEITDNAEGFLEGEFLLNEFVDRYGPRLAHLNGVLQVLSQLSSMPSNSSATN
jgi:hypothetical protein